MPWRGPALPRLRAAARGLWGRAPRVSCRAGFFPSSGAGRCGSAEPQRGCGRCERLSLSCMRCEKSVPTREGAGRRFWACASLGSRSLARSKTVTAPVMLLVLARVGAGAASRVGVDICFSFSFEIPSRCTCSSTSPSCGLEVWFSDLDFSCWFSLCG